MELLLYSPSYLPFRFYSNSFGGFGWRGRGEKERRWKVSWGWLRPRRWGLRFELLSNRPAVGYGQSTATRWGSWSFPLEIIVMIIMKQWFQRTHLPVFLYFFHFFFGPRLFTLSFCTFPTTHVSWWWYHFFPIVEIRFYLVSSFLRRFYRVSLKVIRFYSISSSFWVFLGLIKFFKALMAY